MPLLIHNNTVENSQLCLRTYSVVDLYTYRGTNLFAVITRECLVKVRDDLDALTEDEHDDDADEDEGHVELLLLHVHALRPSGRRHRLLQRHGLPDPKQKSITG